MQDLSKKQQDALLNSTARINIFEGPVRAGKSFIALLRWIDFCANGPPGPLIICGRTDKTIKRNIIAPLQQLIGSAVVYKQGKGEVQLFNRVMYVVGANDDRAEAKIRGSEFAGALIDEVTLIPENFFKMLLSRLSVEGAKLFCSTNPDSPYHYFKQDFIDREKELDMKVFSFNIRDNPSLSEKYIKDLSAEYKGLWHKRYIEGKWVLAEGAVYDFFDEDIHVIPMSYTPASYYILGVDYGTTNPCVFVLIGYNAGAYPNMWLEKEYYYDSKKEVRQKSDYEYALDLIDFIDGHYVKQIYIDPSAASFKQELMRNGVKNVADANNELLTGVRFQSLLMTNGTYKICSNCVESIKEYANYLWDSKASEKGEDRPIKKFDHCFTAGTQVLTSDGYKAIDKISPGEKVLTRSGFRDVIDAFQSSREVDTFSILGREIRCTPDHKFYTISGWKEVSSLISSDILYIELEELPWQKLLFSAESRTDATQTLKTLVTEGISEVVVSQGVEALDIFIETFGCPTMEKYHKDTIFITKIAINTTMTLAISSVSQLVSMLPCMRRIFQRIDEKKETFIFQPSGTKPKSGTGVQPEESGIENMEKNRGFQSNGKLHVNSANKDMSQQSEGKQGFVQISVVLHGEEQVTLMMSQENVLFVKGLTSAINTEKDHFALYHVEEKTIGKEIVYNLHVDEYHEYFVEGILVANSLDAQRYALFTHFFTGRGHGMTERDAEDLERMYMRR